MGNALRYTVRQVAKMSSVSVRMLHFYDETGLLKPAFYGSNGYRYYEEPQLLMLQQILFYRELGFELKQIKQVLGRRRFEKVAALKSHRKILEKDVVRKRTLIETIDKTINHLKGTQTMMNEELFQGFSVAAGKDRFGEQIKLGGSPNDCKLSGQDTAGAVAVFEFTGPGGWPRHLHQNQDEWIYVVEGELQLELGSQQFRLQTGEFIYIPQQVAHVWISANGRPAKIINSYQPAGNIEDFFRALGKYTEPPIHEVLSFSEFREFFANHGMDLLGPPLAGEWKVENDRISRLA